MNTSRNRTILTASGVMLLVGILGFTTALAQFDRLKKAAEKIGGRGPNLSSLMSGTPPITTSLDDAKFGDASRDSFTPEPFSPLASLERTPHGGFILQPGQYEMRAESYCLKAGTHGPGGGDGYLYAPPDGPAKEVVIGIVRNSYRHPQIEQRNIQMLLWAIIARAKFEDLRPELKAIASQLLTPQQLLTLNRNSLEAISGPALQKLLSEAPPAVRQVLEAEARLRQMLTSPGSSFAEMERIAVLSGMAPMGEGSRQIPTGRWSLHPDGYYVRYLPSGYSSTRVEVWVPQGSSAVGKEFDPSMHIAVPGNTARQRLIQSPRSQTQ